MSARRGLTPAAGVVQSILESHELAKAIRPHLAKGVWVEVVGPQIAAVTQVERVQNGTELVVRVKNSVWANELVLLKGDTLQRVNSALGGKVLTDIRFKASGLPRQKPPERTADVFATPVPSDDDLGQVSLSQEAQERIGATVAGIMRDALRERITRALTRAARAEQWKRDHGWLPCSRCGTLTYPTPISTDPLICALCHAGAI